MNEFAGSEKWNDALTHECTSWIVMPELTGGKFMMLHKNRDSDVTKICAARGRKPGKFSWIAVASLGSDGVNMGINSRGLAIAMNSADLTDGKSPGPGLDTVQMARIILEECADTEEAEKKLKSLFDAKNYHHGERGSMWFAADPNTAFIAEHDLKRYAVHKVAGGFAIRANVWHYPEMLIYSQRTPTELANNYRREFAVRNEIFRTGTAYSEMVTPEKMAAASRISLIPEAEDCYPVCGKRTNSAATIAIDREFPQSLSVMYSAFGPPRFTAYLPIPAALENLPDELLDGSFADAVFARRDAGRELLPQDKLTEFERKMNLHHMEAAEKARAILKRDGSRTEAIRLLTDAFMRNWSELRAISSER